jgi:uncharacterized protein (TIGR03085 family)
MSTTQPAAPNALAVAEREALADLMLEVGPDAPTLCGGWTTRDLAAHLVIRSDRPDAAAGIVIPALAGWTAKVQEKAARRDWDDLVRTVRRGAPGWSLQSRPSLDGQSNTIEYFVHHEDVRRARLTYGRWSRARRSGRRWPPARRRPRLCDGRRRSASTAGRSAPPLAMTGTDTGARTARMSSRS